MADDSLLLDTWTINNRVTLYLLDALPPAALPGVGASKGRSVGGMFAHLHNTRLLWLKSASPELLAGVAKLVRSPKNRSSPASNAAWRRVRKSRRYSRDNTFTGRKNPGRQPIQRVWSAEGPPPGTTQCTWG